MSTPYLTPEEAARIVGAGALAAAAPAARAPGVPEPDPPWDRSAVQSAIDAVAQKLDAALVNGYRVPLDDVPDFLARAAARLVHAELVDSATSTDLIQDRAAEAWRLVRQIASGHLRLTPNVDSDPETNARTRQGRTILRQPEPRAYRRRDLRGLV